MDPFPHPCSHPDEREGIVGRVAADPPRRPLEVTWIPESRDVHTREFDRYRRGSLTREGEHVLKCSGELLFSRG